MARLLDWLYLLLLAAASPWLIFEGLRKGKYREGFAAKFLGSVPLRAGNRPCVWLHAVSVGEVNLLATLIATWRQCRPDWQCVVSTTTMTGFRLATKKYPDCTVFYCPLDFSWAVRRAMARVRPACLVLAELELWPNLIAAAQAAGARVVVVNGRLSPRSFRGYRRIRWLMGRVLRQVDRVLVQNDEYAARFRALGAPTDRVRVTGSLKFDGAQADRHNAATMRLAELAGFAPDDVIFLAGSTQAPEEALALAAFRQLAPHHPRLRLVLVPRHPDRFAAIGQTLTAAGVSWQRRSQLDAHGADPQARVLLVDAMGELGAWWGTAQIAFVGGSLGRRGGQNMVEPAAYGAAVSFGPNTQNFRDIVAALLQHDAAVVVSDGPQLTAFVRRCLDEPQWAADLGARASRFVASQQGATRRTWELLEPLVSDNALAAGPMPRGHTGPGHLRLVRR
ncbi:MAG TPA: 3-deoxy-D-manno-octulosonic acid transferase [Pirellulales bacterium]